MSGLASLTANYTDSEEEDVRSNDANVENAEPGGLKAPASPDCGFHPVVSVKSPPSNQRTRLVSYATEEKEDDAADKSLEAAENEDKNGEPVDMDLDTEDDDQRDQHQTAPEKPEETKAVIQTKQSLEDSKQSAPRVDAWTEGAQLPPEPPGSCSPSLQENITRLYNRKMETGYDMNTVIQSKKAFRNPSIYEKLIQFCNINEHGTNFPKDLYDGHLFGPESYYDELAKSQKIDMERREKAAKERQSREASKRQGNEDVSVPTKRRSKWDQGPSVAHAQASSVAGNLPVLRTANVAVSGSASTAKSIPAFGMLKRH